MTEQNQNELFDRELIYLLPEEVPADMSDVVNPWYKPMMQIVFGLGFTSVVLHFFPAGCYPARHWMAAAFAGVPGTAKGEQMVSDCLDRVHNWSQCDTLPYRFEQHHLGGMVLSDACVCTDCKNAAAFAARAGSVALDGTSQHPAAGWTEARGRCGAGASVLASVDPGAGTRLCQYGFYFPDDRFAGGICGNSGLPQ